MASSKKQKVSRRKAASDDELRARVERKLRKVQATASDHEAAYRRGIADAMQRGHAKFNRAVLEGLDALLSAVEDE